MTKYFIVLCILGFLHGYTLDAMTQTAIDISGNKTSVRITSGENSLLIEPEVAAFYPFLRNLEGNSLELHETLDEISLEIVKYLLHQIYKVNTIAQGGRSFEQLNQQCTDQVIDSLAQYFMYRHYSFYWEHCDLRNLRLADNSTVPHLELDKLIKIACQLDLKMLLRSIVKGAALTWQESHLSADFEAFNNPAKFGPFGHIIDVLCDLPISLFPELVKDPRVTMFALSLLSAKFQFSSPIQYWEGKSEFQNILGTCMKKSIINLPQVIDKNRIVTVDRFHSHLRHLLKKALMSQFSLPSFKRTWLELDRTEGKIKEVIFNPPTEIHNPGSYNEVLSCALLLHNGTVKGFRLGESSLTDSGSKNISACVDAASAYRWVFAEKNTLKFVTEYAAENVNQEDNPDEARAESLKITASPKWGEIETVATHYGTTVVGFDTGAIECFADSWDPQCELSKPEKSGCLNAALHLAITYHSIVAVCKNGTIKLWNRKTQQLSDTIRIEALMRKPCLVSKISIAGGLILMLGTKDGSLFFINLHEGTWRQVICEDQPSGHEVTALLGNTDPLAVGFADGSVRIWDHQRKLIRIIQRVEAVPLKITETLTGFMIIYNDGVIDEHVIPETANLSELINLIRKDSV